MRPARRRKSPIRSGVTPRDQLSFVVSSPSTRFVETLTKRVEAGELSLTAPKSSTPSEVRQVAERDIDA